MARILYTARTAAGDKTEGFVEAAGAQAARDQLQSQGLSDVVLHQEAVLAQDAAELAGLSAAQQQALARFSLRLRDDSSLKTALAETARRSIMLLVGVGLVIALAWGMGMTSTVIVGLVVAAAPFALTAWGWRRVDQYQEFLRECAVGRAQPARELAAKLRASGKVTPALEFDLDVRLAGQVARAGDLAGALQSLQPWQERLASQSGLFETRVASVHVAGGDTEGFVRLMGLAYERAGQDPSRGLDYVLAQARFGDADAAEALLARIDASLLPPYASGFVHWAHGLLLARRDQPGLATQPLGQAVAEMLKLAAQPAMWPVLAICSADHALALAATGEHERACAQVAQVWPVLQAHANPTLLQALQAQGLQPACPSDSISDPTGA